MASEFKTRRTVEFADTDAARIMHFSNYFRYMEVAEHRFFRSLGLSVHVDEPGGETMGFARGQAECTYRKALRYGDEVELHVVVRAILDKSITYEVVFSLVDGSDGVEQFEEVARGRMSVVCVSPTGDGLRAISIPDAIKASLEVADRTVGTRVPPGR